MNSRSIAPGQWKKLTRTIGGIFTCQGLHCYLGKRRHIQAFVFEAYERPSGDLLQILCIIAFDFIVKHSGFFMSAVLKLTFHFPSQSHPNTYETVLFTATVICPFFSLLFVYGVVK